MTAKVGSLAIADFDHKKVVCIITKIHYLGENKNGRAYKFIYWDKDGKTIKVKHGELPRNRFTQVAPPDNWDGTLANLTLDKVHHIDMDKTVKLGDCYHDRVAYAIGYFVGNHRIELANKLFTTLNSGINGGVEAELDRIANDSSDTLFGVNLFAVALKPTHIFDNAGCDCCGINDRVRGAKYCINCRLDPDICGCWDHENET